MGDRNVRDPRALIALFEQAEAELAATAHPDPYIRKFSLSPLCLSRCLFVGDVGFFFGCYPPL